MGLFIKSWEGPCPARDSRESTEHVYTKSKARIEMNEFVDLVKRIVANTLIKEKTNYKFLWFETQVNFCFCNVGVIPMLKMA